jgi:uncharacterized membrane protein
MARLLIAWSKIRDSLWFVPAMCTLMGVVLAVAVTEIERQEYLDLAIVDSWLFAGGTEGARGVLSAIATSLITVTGVIFSVTMVALQLASSQFSPRLLRSYTADRGNQWVLGVFIGTFTYALLVLRTIRSASEDNETFVPRIAVTLAVVLLLVTIAYLIYFIDHSAKAIQVANILDRIAKRSLRQVEMLFPDELGHAADDWTESPPSNDYEVELASRRAGYLQAVDGNRLFDLGKQGQFAIWMTPRIGDFLLEGDALAKIVGSSQIPAEALEQLHAAFVIGHERTPEQDVEFGVVELSDIAVRALSPGINDPTTALRCIDRLSELLLAFGKRKAPQPKRTKAGDIHYVARQTTFARAMDLAFLQIRHYGAANPQLAVHLMESLCHLADLLPAARREIAIEHAQHVLVEARAAATNNARRGIIELAAKRCGLDFDAHAD